MRLATLMLTLALALGCASDSRKARHADAVASHHVVDAIPRARSTEYAVGEAQELLQNLERVHFPLDSAVVPDDAREALRAAAHELRELPNLRVYVLGFADEQGAESYNWRLGLERAHAVCSLLQQEGVGMEQVAVISFGEARPAVDARTQAAYSINRRVEFRVMRDDVRITLGTPLPTAVSTGGQTPRS